MKDMKKTQIKLLEMKYRMDRINRISHVAKEKDSGLEDSKLYKMKPRKNLKMNRASVKQWSYFNQYIIHII